MENTEKRRFVKTIEDEDLMRKARNNPLIFFEQYPFRKIRVACVKEIKSNSTYQRYKISKDWIDWIEECISDLLEQNDNFAEELLEWYICEGTEDEIAINAIEFALKLKDKIPVYYNLSKFIAGRLLKGWDIRLYPEIPSLRGYLSELLKALVKSKDGDGYLNSYWVRADRALKIIIAAGDFSFLPQIEELIVLHQNGTLKPWKSDPSYVKDLNIAMLKATRRALYKAQREHLAEKNKQ